jgi:corrinoid protein of di/trimethylamine methyltransferase
LECQDQEAAVHTDVFNEMAKSVIDGEVDEATNLAQKALEQDIEPLDAINNGYVIGINDVGEKFSKGQCFLPELVMAGEAMKAALSVLEPEMKKRGTEREVLGNVVLATIQGDIHDIGKTLVGIMLSANGFRVFDMGVDVKIDALIQKSNDVEANIIAVSALLTTTMINQRTLIEELNKRGVRHKVKVMVGGAPVTRDWADEIGADGYSEDAIGAVSVAKQVLGHN